MSDRPGNIACGDHVCVPSARTATGTSRTSIVLGLIVVLGIALRLWYLSQLAGAPDFSALQQDPEVQDYFARALITG
ncbi:MAG TPA: hypothetical protein PLC40_12170, partial [Candidatus Hydrogenedentes bacterium]|nr:hypothetical protein [Candidatus Hydrogenedentota bacterium]